VIPADAVALGMRLPSVANLREHWAAKARRTGHHRRAGFALARSATSEAERAALLASGCVVTLTRQAPRALDDDNLASAFKAVRDGVAAALGVDDRDPRVRWAYEQARGPAAVRIRLAVAAAEVAIAAKGSGGGEEISARETGPDVADYTRTRVQRKSKVHDGA